MYVCVCACVYCCIAWALNENKTKVMKMHSNNNNVFNIDPIQQNRKANEIIRKQTKLFIESIANC